MLVRTLTIIDLKDPLLILKIGYSYEVTYENETNTTL